VSNWWWRTSDVTRVLLAAGPSLLVVEKDGVLYFRDRRGDRKVPYAPEHYHVFLDSVRLKHDMSQVVGPDGEVGPEIPDDEWPELRPETRSGEGTVFRLLPHPTESRSNRLTSAH
jgi:hypothetical protein